MPHYLRVARALSMVAGFGACAAPPSMLDASADASSVDAGSDVGSDVAGPLPAYCASCTCCGHDSGTGTDTPSCQPAHDDCCNGPLICGPLSPPELA